MSDDDLVPLSDEGDSTGFDVVLRGYDRRQVDEHLDKVAQAWADADRQHADDSARRAALEQQLAGQQSALADAEQRASGLPEPASRLGERLAAMLRLAEQEAAELRDQARAEAERIIAAAQQQADRTTAERTAALDRRERDIAGAAQAAEQTRLDAQRDAEQVRSRAKQEAETMLAQATSEGRAKRQRAEEDIKILHDDARAESAAMTSEARRQVAELSQHRDMIFAQLQSASQTLSPAMPGPSAGQDAQHPAP